MEINTNFIERFAKMEEQLKAIPEIREDLKKISDSIAGLSHSFHSREEIKELREARDRELHAMRETQAAADRVTNARLKKLEDHNTWLWRAVALIVLAGVLGTTFTGGV